MNADQLLQHFDRISEAPDAVERLRRFVLDLAVRGKLVEQDPGDEPAGVLLGRIQASRARLEAEKSIRKNKQAHDPPPQEAPFELPDSWLWTRLAAIADCRLGKMLDKAKNRGTLHPYLRNLNVRWFDFDLADLKEMRLEDSELEEFSLNPGDVLVCEGGEPGRAAVWDGRAAGVYFQKALHRVRLFEGVSPKFLVNALFQAAQSGILEERFTGVTIKHLTGRGLGGFCVPLAPLAEQHRIVAKVDELMAVCDELEQAQTTRENRRDRLVAATLHRLNNPDTEPESGPTFKQAASFYLNHLPRLTTKPEHIQQLRQTILNLAVRGKLVEQDPADEPAASVLEILQAEKESLQNTGINRNRQPIPNFRRQDLAFEIPGRWELTVFDRVFVIMSGVTKGRRLGGATTLKRPYLRVANVQRGFLDLAVVKEIEVRPEEVNKYGLRRGDILMTEGGDWDKLGRAAIWNGEIAECLHQNHIFRLRIARTDLLLPEWVVIYANSRHGRGFFEDASKQTTNLASINMTQLRGCPLPVPPAEEQKKIAARVSTLFQKSKALEDAVGGSFSNQRQLADSLSGYIHGQGSQFQGSFHAFPEAGDRRRNWGVRTK
jgi:type I restriction enzyme S subunit